MKSIVEPLLSSISLTFRKPHSNPQQTLIVATGKAACLMYEKFCMQHPPFSSSKALLIIPEGYPLPLTSSSNVQLIETTHPLISKKSLNAGKELIDAIASPHITSIIALVSGGSSAAVELVDDDRTMDYLNSLITSNKSIIEINAIRAEHSLIKGGKLTIMFPQTMFSVAVMSDIPTPNGYKIVGSMPFYSSINPKTSIYEVTSSKLLVHAIEKRLKKNGYTIRFSTPYFMQNHASLVKLVKTQMMLSDSGEATVIAGESPLEIDGKSGSGKGGRMSHLILSLLDKIPTNVSVEAFATDGVDGNSSAAGGIIPFHSHVERFSDEIRDSLNRFDSATLVKKLGFRIETNATGLNLNDVVIILKK